ncbi:adipogenesis regulatory factor isoform X1 [Pongo abelii]|uniref:adipogenesis regulatory factor isoform X1 n=1 Tax=Pongo abelii TaxID=9601 RepID=UPI00300449DF
MASKGLQDLKQQVEGTAKEAVSAAGAAAQQVVDQATEAGQKGLVGLEGGGQPQHTSHSPPHPGWGPGTSSPLQSPLSTMPQPWTSWPRPPRKPSTRLLTRPLTPSLGSGKNSAS